MEKERMGTFEMSAEFVRETHRRAGFVYGHDDKKRV